MLKRLFGRGRKKERLAPAPRPTAQQPRAGATKEETTVESPSVATANADEARPAAPSLHERIEGLRDRFADEVNDVELVLEGLEDPATDLPQPPLAAQAVLRVLNRSDYDLDELTGHIEKDPALSQTLLRHANSTWYGGSADNPIMAVKTAVQRVGANGVHAAVMQHFVSGELLRPGPKFEDMARKVWQHMVRVAPIAREFTKATRVDPDHAFTAALLHDVGKLVFLNHIGRKRKELRREIQVSPGFVSVALTLLHEPLGEQAALSWGLPGAFAEAIGGHHREYPGEEADLLSEVVYLAEALDIMRLRGDTPNLDSLWTAGRLTGPREMVEGWLANEG